MLLTTGTRSLSLIRQIVFPSRNPGWRFYVRRLAVLIVLAPPFLLLQLCHWVGFAADEILFRGYRKVQIRDPVFVVGVPRSGTTFLHRLLARDFSISAAYQRREKVLAEYANMMAHGQAIYLAARDWVADRDSSSLQSLKQILGRIFDSFPHMLVSPQSDVRETEHAVFRGFSDLSDFVRTDLRNRGLALTEVSRINQYLSKMLVSSETIKNIYEYRSRLASGRSVTSFSPCCPYFMGPSLLFWRRITSTASATPRRCCSR
jgi:hypothetical protein